MGAGSMTIWRSRWRAGGRGAGGREQVAAGGCRGFRAAKVKVAAVEKQVGNTGPGNNLARPKIRWSRGSYRLMRLKTRRSRMASLGGRS
jgi:hypothetical protein